MKKTIYADYRYIGDNGIGRFSREILTRLKPTSLEVSGPPNSPLGTFHTAKALGKIPRRNSIFFSPSYVPPLWSRVPFVFTIHDLNHIDRPENGGVLKRLYYELVMRRGCRKAIKILTVSEFSRKRIVEWSGVSADRVVNVGNGVDENFRPDVQHYDAGFRYLLAVSNRKAHKNDARVLLAFAKAGINLDIKLLFTGTATQELQHLAEQNDVAARIEFLGLLPESKLPSVYAGATALVFPSLYEGFGLPVIEAMACGTPVITSNTTSLPEIAGGAALLVDPTSTDEIAQAIRNIVCETELRALLRGRGLDRAAHFKWEKVAERVRQALAVCDGENMVSSNKKTDV